jgi:hypothetical protein
MLAPAQTMPPLGMSQTAPTLHLKALTAGPDGSTIHHQTVALMWPISTQATPQTAPTVLQTSPMELIAPLITVGPDGSTIHHQTDALMWRI